MPTVGVGAFPREQVRDQERLAIDQRNRLAGADVSHVDEHTVGSRRHDAPRGLCPVSWGALLSAPIDGAYGDAPRRRRTATR